MTIRFSKLAVYKLERLSQYLAEKWSEQSKMSFLDKLDSKLKSIQTNPKAFPQSELSPGLRKCVITKQTTVLYELSGNTIYILTIIDARQAGKTIRKEIQHHFPRQGHKK